MGKPITTHAGEIFREEFMVPYGMNASAMARALAVPVNRIADIIAPLKPRAVTPDTALRLARYFGTTPQLWMNLRQAHDLSQAVALHGDHISAVVQPKAA